MRPKDPDTGDPAPVPTDGGGGGIYAGLNPVDGDDEPEGSDGEEQADGQGQQK